MRFLRRLIFISCALLAVAVLALWLTLRASLPALDGELSLPGLSAPVQIGRDDLGVVTIHAANRRDAALATGFVHAEERFFQMDLLRRFAAGELSALVGEAAVDHDMRQRIHRMRGVARRVIQMADDSERDIIEAYAEGVDAGVAALAVRPFEYLLLRGNPARWLPEDTVLVVLAMYFRLQDERASREGRLARLHAALPGVLYAFLTQRGTTWDAPLQGQAEHPLPVPGAAVCDLRASGHERAASVAPSTFADYPLVGSNAWAVSARRTRDGAAILASDMHLALAMPNTWFRLRLRVAGDAPSGSAIDVTGVTLPGTPAIVAGSNGRVAWGLTNTYGDWVDLIELEVDPGNPHRYRTPDGFRDFEEHTEVIQVRGAASRSQVVRSTIWGPVIDGDAGGPPRALHWLAHAPRATNLALLEMETARDVREAVRMAHRSGIPPQNLVVADSQGNVGWTIMGRIPRRRGYDPSLPSSWAEAGRGWEGWLAEDDYPVILNPPSGAVWTANARVVDGEALAAIGDGGYALGARASQIRDRLLDLREATEADMLAIQLDDRALFLARWRVLLLGLLTDGGAAGNARREALLRVVQAGARRAAVDDAGYRLVREFRRQVSAMVLSAIVKGCGGLDMGNLAATLRQWEGPLWQILQQRPAHLLDPRYPDWRSLELAAADAAIRSCGEAGLEHCSWGAINGLAMHHPLSSALPLVARWLDAPSQPLPGDIHMPRVQRPAMGASERFAVSPGREARGYFHMPGGQSGHPLSPFYLAGHRAWVDGEPTPFLPGAEIHRLTLKPAD